MSDSLQQNVIHRATNDWELRVFMYADEQHEHLLWKSENVMNTSIAINFVHCKKCSFTANVLICMVLKFSKVRQVH